MDRLIFAIFSLLSGILVFAVCSNNVSIYAQQSYLPAAAPTPLLSQSPQQANSTANVPIVLPLLPGGTCPQGYHLVSASVCIKDLPSSAASKTTPATNTANSFSAPLPPTTQPNSTNPTNNNNEGNFGTKILKSFNQELK
jgi:hypothetical protein